MNLRIIGIFNKLKSSSLLRSSGIYTITNFINAAIPFLLLKVLTTELSPSDYGIVAMFQITISLIYPIISITLESAISRKYYDKDHTDFSLYLSNCVFLVFCSSFIVLLVLFIFYDYFQQLTQIPVAWLKYVIIVAVAQFFTSTLLVVYQVMVKPIKYGIFQITQSVFNISLTLFLILVLSKKWEGRLEAQLITTVFFAGVSLFLLYRGGFIKLKIKREYLIHALKFGLPVIPHAIGGIIFTAIDRFFLTKMIGLEQTGNYTVAYQIGAIIGLFTVAFNNAYVPWLFENLQQNNLFVKEKIVKMTYAYYLILLLIASILLFIFPFLINNFVGGAFQSIDRYSVFITFGFVFNGMYLMVTNYIFYAEKTKIQGILTISVALMKVPITYFSIKYFGAVGASISFCLTYFVFFVITWFYSNKVYPMPWNIMNVLGRKRIDI